MCLLFVKNYYIGINNTQQRLFMKKSLISLLFLVVTMSLHAQETLDKIHQKINNANHDTTRVIALTDLMRYYLVNNPDSFTHYNSIARELATKIKYEKGIALVGEIESVNYENVGDYTNASKLLNQSLQSYYRVDYTKGIARVYNRLGVIEAKQTNYKVATNYFLRSLVIHEKNKDTAGIVQSYIRLGLVNMYLENINKAKYFFNTALEFNKNNLDAEIAIYNNLGTLYGRIDDLKNASKYLELARIKTEKQSSNSSNAFLYINLGNVYYQLKDLKRAEQNYNKALTLALKFNILEDQARVYYNMALLYDKDEIDKNIDLIKKAVKIANQLNDYNMKAEMNEQLYKSYELKGDYKSAFNAFKAFHEASDSLVSDERRKDVELIQADFEISKSKAEIKELAFLYNQKKFRNIIYIVLILASLIIIVILLYGSRQRKKLNNQLLDSIHVREKLLSIIAHDLKSPINSVVGIIDLFEMGNLDEKDKSNLLTILRKHILLTNDTLDTILKWGQTQLKGITVNKVKLNLNSLINKNIDLLSLTAKQKSINLINNSNFDAYIEFDEDQLNFILRNLISNAIKFSKRKSDIILTMVNEDKYLKVSIKDTGLGMDKKVLDSLFTNKQIVNYGTDNEKGGGLGLTLCKEFVEANNGKIEVESEVNIGSTFNVYIPIF